MAALRMGSMLTAAIALGPALAAIPALAAGAAVGIGTLAGAFTGVMGALKDYAAQQNSAAQTGSAAAATAFSNALAIRNAQQAITDAKASAAQAAVSSARQIAGAEQALADTQRQAAIAAESSADAVVSAEQRLETQQQSLTQAQETLTQAQRAGADVLKDLDLAAEGAANSVVDAELAVEAATEANNRAKGNSLLTDNQKKQAAQQLVDAQFRLKDAQQKASEAQKAATEADAKGVDGSTAVVAAKAGVVAATQGVADAQHSLARTQEAAGNQQIASAEAVAKSQQNVADAFAAAAQQQVQSQQQVDRAVQALADTQRQQALAAASASAGTNKFAADMKGLTQPGRDFVNTVLGMKSGLHELSATAQTATLPGFTQMLRDSQGMFPIVNQAIKDMGGAVGDAAKRFGDLMKSPAFQGDMTKILKQASDFTSQVASGIVDMVGGIAKAAANAGPIVKGLSQGFADLAKTGIPAFFAGLTSNAAGSGKMLQSVLDLASGLLGPLGTLAGAVSGALGPAFAELVPHLTHFVDLLVQSLLPEMPALSQALDSIARILGEILVIAQPLIPLMAQDFANTLKILNPLLSTLANLLDSNHGWLGQVTKVMLEMANPAHLMITALGWVADHFDSLKATVASWIGDVKHWWDDAGKWFDDKWRWIGDQASKAWRVIYDVTIKPVTDAYNFIVGPHGFGGIVSWFANLDMGKSAGHMWDWIKESFKDAINAVIGWWDNLSFGLPKVHIPGLGDVGGGTIGVPHIAPLKAVGGIASGLTGIGEAGVEMVRLPSGSVVMPHANTTSALASGGFGGGGGTLQAEWVGGPPLSDQLGAALFELFRNHIRITAGNGPDSVQRALGQAY
jgi:hypothetical protein